MQHMSQGTEAMVRYAKKMAHIAWDEGNLPHAEALFLEAMALNSRLPSGDDRFNRDRELQALVGMVMLSRGNLKDGFAYYHRRKSHWFDSLEWTGGELQLTPEQGFGDQIWALSAIKQLIPLLPAEKRPEHLRIVCVTEVFDLVHQSVAYDPWTIPVLVTREELQGPSMTYHEFIEQVMTLELPEETLEGFQVTGSLLRSSYDSLRCIQKNPYSLINLKGKTPSPKDIHEDMLLAFETGFWWNSDNCNDLPLTKLLAWLPDLVVTSSCTLAHVAAASGRETHVVVPQGPEGVFYWQMDAKPEGGRSRWYPNTTVWLGGLASKRDWAAPVIEPLLKRLKEQRHVQPHPSAI